MSRLQHNVGRNGGADATRGGTILGVEMAKMVLLVAAALAATVPVASTDAVDLLGFKGTCGSICAIGSIVGFVEVAIWISRQL